MKKLILFAGIVILAACSNEQEQKSMLVGKWQYDGPAITQAYAENNPTPEQQVSVERFVTLYQNDAFIFREDGSMGITSAQGSTLKGTWDVTPDGNTLVMNLGSEKLQHTITELTEDQLVLAADTTRRINQFTRILKKVAPADTTATE